MLAEDSGRQRTRRALEDLLDKHHTPSRNRALLQIGNSVVPYGFLWLVMARIENPLIVIALAVLAALFLVRIFVLQHDCGHNSLFASSRANDFFGNALSVLTFTPLLNWRFLHNMHHATTGNLDKRLGGDIWLMTRSEYEKASKLTRLKYRLYRHPIFLFLLGPATFFLLRRRFPIRLSKHMRRARRNVFFTDLALLTTYGLLAFFIGIPKLLLIASITFPVCASIGVWLFYIQHHYENAYWQRTDRWDYFQASIDGSSYYDLPRWAHWFTADISVHHIHHLDSKIPNYRLRECMDSHPAFEPKHRIRFFESLRLPSLTLWDEEAQKMVRFSS